MRKPLQNPSAGPKSTRRSSPDVVEKRRAARAFNEALLGQPRPNGLDGRTERRRKRLLKELAKGTTAGGRELKPIDVLLRVEELLGLGEALAALWKAFPRPRAVEATAEIVERVRQIHRAYRFPVGAYRFVGLDEVALKEAGVLKAEESGEQLREGVPSVRRGAA